MEKNHSNEKGQNSDNLYHVSYENYLNTNACTECTGLMPKTPDGQKEWDSYLEIYDFLPIPPKDQDRN